MHIVATSATTRNDDREEPYLDIKMDHSHTFDFRKGRGDTNMLFTPIILRFFYSSFQIHPYTKEIEWKGAAHYNTDPVVCLLRGIHIEAITKTVLTGFDFRWRQCEGICDIWLFLIQSNKNYDDTNLNSRFI